MTSVVDTGSIDAEAEEVQAAIEEILPEGVVYFCFIARSDGMTTTLSNIEPEACEKFLSLCQDHLREQTSQKEAPPS